ncbi:MAG: hypothetical protein U0835_24890 [Isosphaeraceae bacterium]
MTGFSGILLPTDRGEPALDALGLASTLVRRDGRLIVARIEPPEGGDPRACACPCACRGEAAPTPDPAARPRIEHLVRTGP